MLAEVVGNDSFGQREELKRTEARLKDAFAWAAKWSLRLAFLTAAAAATVASCATVTGCTPAARRGAVNALFATADVACIIAAASLPNESAIADACGLSHQLEPYIKTIVAQQRVAVARQASAMVCK